METTGNKYASGQGVETNPTLKYHLNNLHRRLVNQETDTSDLTRRIENIEKFLGVSFSVPRGPSDIDDLRFTE